MIGMRAGALALGIMMVGLCSCSKTKSDEFELSFAEQEEARLAAEAEAARLAAEQEWSSSLLLPPDDSMRPTGPGLSAEGALRTVFFDYDQAHVRIDQRDVLDQNYQYLAANLGARVLIEGHCDERGTIEYNFALGEKRASVVRDYLIHRGIDPLRLKTLSFGEEAPAVSGKGDAIWSQNRRAEFKFEE